MKMKFINKILAMVVASATIAATPGFASAGNGDKSFLGKKRNADHSKDEGYVNTYSIVVGNVDDFPFEYRGLVERIGYAANLYPERNSNALAEMNGIVEQIEDRLKNGAKGKYIAQIINKLITTPTYSRLFFYRLNRMDPEVDYTQRLMDCLKKCQNDEDARPFVLQVASKLLTEICDDIYSDRLNNFAKEDQVLVKYKDKMQAEWINANLQKNKEAENFYMQQCSKNFSGNELKDLVSNYRKAVDKELGVIIDSALGIPNGYLKNEKSDDVAENKKLVEDFLNMFLKITESHVGKLEFKSENLNDLLAKYAQNCESETEAVLKFSNMINIFIKKELLSKNADERILKVVAELSEKNKLTSDFVANFNPNNDLDKKKLQEHVDITGVFVSLIEYGWFDNYKDGGEFVSSMFEKLLYAYSNGSNANLNNNEIPNNRKIVAENIFKLAKRGALKSYFESARAEEFGEKFISILNVCTDDAGAADYVLNTIKFLLEKDDAENGGAFGKFIGNNAEVFMDLLQKCLGYGSRYVSGVSNNLELIFSAYVKYNGKKGLAEFMKSKAANSDVLIEDKVVNMLKSCDSGQCFKVLFDNYFTENVSKENVSEVLELLLKFSKCNYGEFKSETLDIFKKFVQKFDYDLPKGTMIKLLDLFVNESDVYVLDFLKILLVDKGRMGEFFDSKPGSDEDYASEILEMLREISERNSGIYIRNVKVNSNVLKLVKQILDSGKINDSDKLKFLVCDILCYCCNNSDLRRLSAERMVDLLEKCKFKLPNNSDKTDESNKMKMENEINESDDVIDLSAINSESDDSDEFVEYAEFNEHHENSEFSKMKFILDKFAGCPAARKYVPKCIELLLESNSITNEQAGKLKGAFLLN